MTRDELRAAYPLGCRVVATAKWHEQFRIRTGKADTGRVVGYGQEEDQVVIVRDGQTSRVTYHVQFWDVIV